MRFRRSVKGVPIILMLLLLNASAERRRIGALCVRRLRKEERKDHERKEVETG